MYFLKPLDCVEERLCVGHMLTNTAKWCKHEPQYTQAHGACADLYVDSVLKIMKMAWQTLTGGSR